MNKKINQLTQKNKETLENFFQKMKNIVYRNGSKQSKIRQLYGAHYWTNYFMNINNHLIEKEFHGKCRCKKPTLSTKNPLTT
jgi:hypothetical protein